jgi:hypothetical protein
MGPFFQPSVTWVKMLCMNLMLVVFGGFQEGVEAPSASHRFNAQESCCIIICFLSWHRCRDKYVRVPFGVVTIFVLLHTWLVLYITSHHQHHYTEISLPPHHTTNTDSAKQLHRAEPSFLWL